MDKPNKITREKCLEWLDFNIEGLLATAKEDWMVRNDCEEEASVLQAIRKHLEKPTVSRNIIRHWANKLHILSHFSIGKTDRETGEYREEYTGHGMTVQLAETMLNQYNAELGIRIEPPCQT